MLLVTAALFVAFIPGVFVTLPYVGAPQWQIYAVHALLFAVVKKLVSHYVCRRLDLK
jgi:hypothetical protein